MRFAVTISLLASFLPTVGCCYPKVDHQLKVVDLKTGLPIKDARVSVSYGSSHSTGPLVFLPNPHPQTRTRQTDRDGIAKLPVVEDWRHGFTLTVASVVDWLSQSRRLESGASLELPSGFALERLDADKTDPSDRKGGT